VIAAVLVAIGASVAWDQYERGGSKAVPWTDVTAKLGEVRWPKRIGRSLESRAELVRELRDAQPIDTPAAPMFDFTRRRLVLAAAGPRSSTGYDVRVVRVVERRDRVDVDVREIAPTLRRRVRAKLTFPYRLLAIPAGGKRVQVRWEGRA
jgi:hypothetical protein